MSAEAVGVYILLLCEEWTGGPLTTDADRLAALLRIPTETLDKVWRQVAPCFEKMVGIDGVERFVNLRLEEVREKQLLKATTLSKRGSKGAKARWHNR